MEKKIFNSIFTITSSNRDARLKYRLQKHDELYDFCDIEMEDPLTPAILFKIAKNVLLN